MMRRYLITLFSTLMMLGAYSVYAQVSQRLLSRSHTNHATAKRPIIHNVPSIGPRISQETAEKYLPDAPWAVNARAKIRADGLHLFFNEKKLVNGNTEIEVSPVAMVFMGDETENPDDQKLPIVVLAERAIFQLDEAAELSEIRTRMINKIMFLGGVLIRGDDNLQVRGSNFAFSRDNKNISSYSPIHFRFQEHQGLATNIQINLQMRDGGAYADNPQIESVTDIFISEHLEMNLKPDGDEPPVLVTSEGSFNYVFDTQLAILKQDVLVYRMDKTGLADSLTCDSLALQFGEKLNAIPSENNTLGGSSNLELISLTATGNEVIAKSSANQLEAVGERLTYLLRENKLILQKNRGVEIEYRGAELFTPRLEIQVDDHQQPIFAKCDGPGQVKYLDKPDGDSVQLIQQSAIPAILAQANWQESLTFMPDADSQGQLDLITLTGKAVMHSPVHQSGIISNSIKVWLKRIEQETSVNASTNKSLSQEQDVQIVRTFAEQNVAVVSPYLEGEYESLDIHFDRQSIATLAALKGETPETTDSTDTTTSNNVASDPAGQSAATEKRSPLQKIPKEPFKIDATHLTLQVVHDPEFKDVHVAHVKTEGIVKANGLIEGQDDPVHLDGQSVDIANGGEERQRFHLLGTDERYASIRSGEMRIDGIDLFVDRAQNFSRVMGGGAIEFPVKSNWNGDKLQQAQILEVSWKEQMRFEGRTAHFVGTVRATIGDSVITCEELKVHLDQPISLKSTSMTIKPQIASIECRDRVRFEMNQYENGVLIGIRYLDVWSYTMNQQTGAMNAQGPGTIEFWQRSNGKASLGLPQGMMGKSTSEKSPAKKSGWDYTRITFAGHMDGNYLKRQGTLHDRVNVLHGPVSEPLSRFGRDNRPPQSVWVQSQLLEVALREVPKDPKKPAEEQTPWSIEVQAKGNAEIEGDQFLAKADLVTFDQSNQMFTMRSLENRHATIWHYEHPQAARSRYDVKMIRISPDGNILELDRTLGASGSR
ncbi:hypothetical protein [uncultured Rubinisphaera sp.]|uniref:hypothetical protein n=1 Tax=uncultured Rubinisphaera sp. TaxID=1678686 RepID=UPI0030D93853